MSGDNVLRIEVSRIKGTSSSKEVKAYADVVLRYGNDRLILRGWAVVDDGSGPWVGAPSARSNSGQYHKLVEAEGELDSQITSAILTAYEQWKQKSDKNQQL